MGTRAIVAAPHGDSWRGRHTHWDGYPTGRGPDLWAIVQRDGVEKARQVITADHYGWSIIKATQADEPQDSPQFVAVPGYGVAYTHHDIGGQGLFEKGYTQSSESDWLGPNEDWGTADTEWAYVLADDGIWVFTCHFDGGRVTPVGQYRWDEAEPDWQAVEEGANA